MFRVTEPRRQSAGFLTPTAIFRIAGAARVRPHTRLEGYAHRNLERRRHVPAERARRFLCALNIWSRADLAPGWLGRSSGTR